ncbi:MAG: hypothetical protein ABI432_06215 [Flavobacteriales bacterium]
MKPLPKLAFAASLAAIAATQGQAQSVGAACGCPDVSSRTVVTLDPTSAPSVVAANGDMIPASYTMTCNNLYLLNDRFYVPAGKDLYIEPGTVIKVANIGGGNGACLIVSRQGQIWANGTETCPIIFTAQADGLTGSYAVTNRGKWGGLILLGRAYNNVRSTDVGSVALTGTDGVGLIEGLLSGDNRNYYGAAVGAEVNDDNSGVLRYVSLRHGGEKLGTNNEINGLTLGSVGSGTTIDHVEVIGNLDDCFEFFGGSVNAKYLVGMHTDDDGLDWDQGFSGKLQFYYGLQGPENNGGALNQGDNGVELDSDDHSSNTGQRATAQIWNATIFSRTDGVSSAGNLNPLAAAGDEAIEAKERTWGSVNNSIFCNFRSGLNLAGAAGAANTTDIWIAGNFNVKNCTFQGCAEPLRINNVNTTSGADFNRFTVTDGNTIIAAQALLDATFDVTPLTSNTVVDRVNPVPAAGTATSTLKAPSDGFLAGVKYRGAFEPGKTPWTQGWTLASKIGSDVSAVSGCAGDIDKDGDIDSFDFGLFVNAFNGTCY